MTAGMQVEIRPERRYHYRRKGSPMSGVLMELSPSGAVARVAMDDIADSYVLVADLVATADASSRSR